MAQMPIIRNSASRKALGSRKINEFRNQLHFLQYDENDSTIKERLHEVV